MPWLWCGFVGVVAMLLVLHRRVTTATQRNAMGWTVAWFAIGLSFVALVYPIYEHAWFGAKLHEPTTQPGADAAMMFVSAYVVEYALAVDVVFVIAAVCHLYRVPKRDQERVLFWSLVGALGLRMLSVAGTAWLARAFASATDALGVLALLTVFWIVRAQDEDAKPGAIGRLLWRRRRVTHDDGLGTFVVRQDGRYVLTMMAACVLTSVALDVQYALDSAVVAIAVSKTTFILVTANVLAAFAIRGGYFVLQRVQYPAAAHTVNIGLFALAGLKLLVLAHAPPLLVLGVSLAVVGAGFIAIAVRVLSD